MSNVYFKPSSEFFSKANQVFENQKSKLNKLIPYADIQHIGSTSIPHSLTKGDLDLVVRVPLDKFKESIEVLKKLYEVNQLENWADTFASFKDERNFGIDFGVQLVVKDSISDDFVKLRDILIKNPQLVEELNNLKMRHEGKNMDSYRKAKADFFQRLRAQSNNQIDKYQIYLSVIRESYPKILKDEITVFDEGWDYLVVLVKDTAFRFPKREKRAKRLPTEVNFLTQFADKSPIKVPKPELHTSAKLEFPYSTYNFIPGVQFKNELAKSFSKEERLDLATKLGKFLTALHSFPPKKVTGLEEYRLDPLESWMGWLEEIRKVVFPKVSLSEQQWIENLFANFFKILKISQINFCITHSDVSGNHIIVDPKFHSLVGIIDFGDILISDPAYDFSYLSGFGEDFLEKVYESYKAPRDDHFELRRKFYGERLYATNLLHYLNLKDKENIKSSKKQLSEYIKLNAI